MTGQQLRNSILQEAIQGRLVPNVLQSGEKTGAELLQDILAERQKKENEEKGKKARKLTLSIIEEEPWELPEGWCWCLLPEVSNIEYGFPFDSTKFNEAGQGMPLIRIRDVVPGRTKTFTTEKAPSEYIIHRGDMLTGMDGNFNVNFWDASDAYLNQRVCKILANEKALAQKFLFYYLPTAFKAIEEEVSFVTVKHLSDKILKSLAIPLPPLSVQKAIVAKLEELLPLVDEYDKAAGELKALNETLPDKLRKSVLQEAIHGNLVPNDIPEGEATAPELLQQILKERQDRENKEKGKKAKKLSLSTIDEEPWELPEGWCWCHIHDVAHTELGKMKDSEKNKGEFRPYLCTINVREDGIDFSNVKQMKFTDEECEHYLLQKSDLLICEGGDCGRCSIWDYDMEMYYQNSLHCVRFEKELSSKYFKSVLDLYKYLGLCNGQGVGIKHFTQTLLRGLCFPLPPLSIQHRIVEKIEELFSAIKTID